MKWAHFDNFLHKMKIVQIFIRIYLLRHKKGLDNYDFIQQSPVMPRVVKFIIKCFGITARVASEQFRSIPLGCFKIVIIELIF